MLTLQRIYLTDLLDFTFAHIFRFNFVLIPLISSRSQGEFSAFSSRKEFGLMEKSQTGTVTGGRLNLREKPSVQSRRLILIPDGTQIAVSEYDAQWYKAQYKAYDGYVMKQFVQLLPALPNTWSYGKTTLSKRCAGVIDQLERFLANVDTNGR